MICTIERFIDHQWIPAATVEAIANPNNGHGGPTRLEYLPSYALAYLDRRDAALACGYAVGFASYREPAWPAFLLDLLPQGAGRQRVLANIGIRPGQDGPASDWRVLLAGADNPIGNLRISEACGDPGHPPAHHGFTREDIIARHETFIEYAQAHGAPMAGSSGAQGESPKLLLSVDAVGRWHADGALPDAGAHAHYLVKFPRGKHESDYRILRNEAGYYSVARQFGIRVGPALHWEGDVLFISRFDRARDKDVVDRYGVESLYALAGVTDFGVSVSNDRLVAALARYSSDPQKDVVEYVMRDLLNVALRNTDNHGRNTAVLKKDGMVRLSPLYDFAPMFLDDSGIARVCRWEGDAEIGARPVWGRVAERMGAYGVDPRTLRERLAGTADTVRSLPETMDQCGVESDLIEQLYPGIIEVANNLADATPASPIIGGIPPGPSP